jgi:hypothetical protein
MISKSLFSSALIFEAGSWAVLATDLSDGQRALAYALSHGLGCALLTAAMWLLLPQRYRAPLPWSPLFIFSLAFFIPLLGVIGVMTAIFPALYLPRPRETSTWQAMGIPTLPFQAKERMVSPIFVDGGLQDVLRYAPDPDQRLSALLATRSMAGRDAVPILKQALGDPSDDVRLLAYSMLDKQENDINQRIQAALNLLPGASPQVAGAQHARMARWYWELAYLGLAQGSVLDHVLNQASDHAEQGLAAGEGGELLLLAGRIALERDDLDLAQTHLHQAQASGMDATKVVPFHAEIAFRTGRYREIPELLARLPEDMLQRPPFAALARCWL